MKYLYTSILLCIIGFCFASCDDSFSQEQNIPYAPCNFVIDINNADNHLNGSYNMGVYINHADKPTYDKLIQSTTVVKSYSTPRLGSETYGFSGVLILNRSGSFTAYDLCCPNEGSRLTRVVPNNNYKAKCTKCGSIFDLDSRGIALSGPAKEKNKKLQEYNVISNGDTKYRVVH